MSKEIWKDVPGYKGYYQISNRGRVKSLPRKVMHKTGSKMNCRGRIMKGNNSWLGYWRVTLKKKGTQRYLYNHTLVALCFIDKNFRKKGLQVNHINGIKGDCRLENLEVVTHSGNMAHAKRMGLFKPVKGEKHSSATLKEKEIPKIRKMWKSKKYLQIEIAEKFGVAPSVIYGIVYNKTWRHVK